MAIDAIGHFCLLKLVSEYLCESIVVRFDHVEYRKFRVLDEFARRVVQADIFLNDPGRWG